MQQRLTLITLAIWMCGCMLASAPSFQELSQLTGFSGSAFSEFGGTESTIEVNKSWLDMNKIQAKFINSQLDNIEAQNRIAARRKATTLGILKDLQEAENGDPIISDLILYVQNGGDPQFALNYALHDAQQRKEENEIRQATVTLLKQMAGESDTDPNLSKLAAWVEDGGDPTIAMEYALDGRVAGDRVTSKTHASGLPLVKKFQ